MNEIKCPDCSKEIPPNVKACPACGKELPKESVSIVQRLIHMPFACKIALLGSVLFIPGFLFSSGSAMIWGAIFLGIGFFLHLIKVGV